MTFVPAAWTREKITYSVDCALYREPTCGGMVTVDYAKRGFRLGCTTTGRLQNEKTYEGRGWRERLEQDAAAYLQSALNGHSSTAASNEHREEKP